MPLILVVAPPGYGKTTLLAQWVAESGGSAAWISVDDSDNDPARLLGNIAQALQRVGALDAAAGPASSGGRSIRHVVVSRLTSAIAERGPVLLLLDDVERLRSRSSRQLIRALAMHLPAGSRLVAASTYLSSEFVGRLRSEHRCAEFGAEDLAFDHAEARALFDGIGFDCPRSILDRLVHQTEGWPVGLSLAGLRLAGRSDLTVAARDWGGHDAFVVEYVRDVVLDAEPADTVSFLLRTAVLGRLSGPLCDAVLDRTGSTAALADLARRNRFVIPVDRDGEWYRYHRLVAEALRAELRRREPDLQPTVLGRAARWFADRPMPYEAITHAIASRSVDLANRLIVAHASPLLLAGRTRPLVEWLEDLGERAFARDPRMALVAAWTWASKGEPVRALRAVQAARLAAPDVTPPGGAASMAAAIATLDAALAPLGVERMLADAQHAFDLEAPGGPWHASAAALLGTAQLLNDAPDAATKTLTHAVHTARDDSPPTAVHALAELAQLAVQQGHWTTAEAYARDACGTAETNGLRSVLQSILPFAVRARVAARSGEERTARRYAARALRLYAEPSPVAFPWLGVQVAVALGHAALEMGDAAKARRWVTEADEHLARLLTEGTLGTQLAALAAAIDDAAASGSGDPADHAPDAESVALTAAELRVLELLPTHLNLADIGDELYISRNTVKTHVAAIYRKLGAPDRRAAVQQARRLGLIDGAVGSITRRG